MGNHVGAGNDWRGNWWRKRENVRSRTVCTDVVLVGSKLASLSSDAFEILLSRCICETDLKKETFFTNWLTMKLANDLVTDLSALEAIWRVSGKHCMLSSDVPSEANATTVVVRITKDSAGADSVVHKDSTKFLQRHQ
jgi:hypothetical protein